MMINKLKIASICIAISGCATPAQLVVDPQSISNQSKFATDSAECRTLAESYKGNAGTTAGAAVIGGTAAGVATVAATFVLLGPIALPITTAAAIAGGGLLGTGSQQNKINRSRENITVQCMNERGYKAYSPNVK